MPTIPRVGARTVSAGLVCSLVALLAGCVGSGPTTSAPSEAPIQAATPTAQATPSPLGRVEGDLEPGTHILDLVGLDQVGTGPGPTQLPKVEITVPEGWYNGGGWVVRKAGPFSVAVMFWDIANVYPTPCEWKGEPMVDPGSDVDGLASALADQPLRSATAPVDVELGGFSGKYLEWSVPTDIDFDNCDEGFFESWTANGWASDRFQQEPGQVDRLWIMDVDGERLVIDATYVPGATDQDRADLESVVDSIRFP